VADVLEIPLAEFAGEVEVPEDAVRGFKELKNAFDPDVLEDRPGAKGICVITLADEAYPSQLKEVQVSPPALLVKGGVPEAVPVALVGSRKAPVAGLETDRALGRALGERGVCVVSGLALGVDAAAHEGVLEAEGTTVGVLGAA
jgi:DNA processing protein